MPTASHTPPPTPAGLRGGYQTVWTKPGQKFSKLIHIVGRQGSGKSTRARKLIADFEAQGKTAVVVDAVDFRQHQYFQSARSFNDLRSTPIRKPYQEEETILDFVIVEHEDWPQPYMVLSGDEIINLYRPAA